MGNLSGTPRAPANPTIPTAPAAPKGVTGSVAPKVVVAPAARKNAAAPQTPTNPTAPALPGLPSLPKPPTGTSNPAAPAKPAAPTAPTGKGIHFGGRRKKRARKKQCGGYKIQYNIQKEDGPFAEDDFTIGESVIIEGDGGKREGFISSVQPVGVQLSRRRRNGDYEGLQFYLYDEIESIRRAWKKNNPQEGGRRRSRKKRGGAKAARAQRATEAAEVTTTPTGIAVVAPAIDPAHIAAADLAAALEPLDAIPAPPMPASPAQAATNIQARYRGNRGRWLAEHRREGLQRREERRQRRREERLRRLGPRGRARLAQLADLARRGARAELTSYEQERLLAQEEEAEAEQNALNMAPTGIFWLDRARVPDAVAHAYATAPASVAEAASAAARDRGTSLGDGGGAHFTRRTFTGGRRRSRKKRNHRSHRRRRRRHRRRGAGILDFFKDTPKKKQTRKEKEEREERNKDAIAEQRSKLRLAAAAEQDYLASTKQEGIPNIERMAKMRTAARTAWEYFMTTADYQKFLYETWKVNWGGVPPTEEEMGLIRSLKRYDPAGYRAVQQRTPPAQQGGKRRRKTRRHKRR